MAPHKSNCYRMHGSDCRQLVVGSRQNTLWWSGTSGCSVCCLDNVVQHLYVVRACGAKRPYRLSMLNSVYSQRNGCQTCVQHLNLGSNVVTAVLCIDTRRCLAKLQMSRLPCKLPCVVSRACNCCALPAPANVSLSPNVPMYTKLGTA